MLAILVCRAALSATSAGAKPVASDEKEVPVEVFEGPHPKHLNKPSYPREEVETLGEGWVKLGFMVDPTGKPFEITILDSMGNKDFEDAAVGALRRSTFKPGTFNGKPTESGSELTYRFVEVDPDTGAQPPFRRAYESLSKAIAAKDRSAADAAMSKLKITNLYEDAFFGLAQYYYAQVWGTAAQQLAGLVRAVANDDAASVHYLPKNVRGPVLRSLFNLEIKTHEYAEATATARLLQKLGVDRATEAKIKSVLGQLETLRSDDRGYGVAGVMPNGSWSLELFKRHFSIEVAEGYVSQVKLRCQRGYLFFAFDPKLQYEVKGKYGSCQMELLGAPGTKFTLFQF